jgi:hypothetical protein
MRVSSEGGQEVRLFAGVPLSGEGWQPLADGWRAILGGMSDQ